MKTFKRAFYAVEKVLVAVSLLACFGVVGEMGKYGFITLEDYRVVITYCVVLGLFLGVSYKIFDFDGLKIQYAYIIHFLFGYISLVVIESVMIKGSLIPSGYPLDYLLKLFWYVIAYTIISVIEYFKSKWEVNKMNQKVNELKTK